MTKPRCRYFGKCGGCSFQDIEYNEQVETKRKALLEATGFKDIVIHAGEEYGYRNRMDMIFNPKGIGFRLKGTWDTPVDVGRCEISDDKLNEIIKEIRGFFRDPDCFDLRKKTGTLRYAVIRTSSGGASVSFVLNSESSRVSEARKLIKEFAGKSSVENVMISEVPPNTDVSVTKEHEVVKGNDWLEESFSGKLFRYMVQGFFQNNAKMAGKMHEHVSGLLSRHDLSGSRLIDLYGGVGTFGIVNADKFRAVTIVEGDQDAVECAMKNIRENNASNAEAVCLKDRFLKELEFSEPLTVIADPPRAGLHPKALRWILSAGPEILIYVSCNPRQLGKDLARLEGYEIKSVHLFDFFPQTPHFESVVELERRSQ